MGTAASKRRFSGLRKATFSQQSVSKYIDGTSAEYIKHLREAVAIPSISTSSNPSHHEASLQMVNWMEALLKETLGAATQQVQFDRPQESSSESLPVAYPPLLLASLGEDVQKKTVLVYGHLDVQPAGDEDDTWNSEPFELTEIDGHLIGRGTLDNKGPILAWVHAIQAFLANGIEVPVNVKFILDSTQHLGSIGLETIISTHKDTFFGNVDFIALSSNSWLGTKKPCIIYGTRGLAYFNVGIESAQMDLHSGTHGGAVYEAMTDLIHLLSRLVDTRGNILVPEILDDVLPLSKEEEKMYTAIDFLPKNVQTEIGAKELPYNADKLANLTHRWRYPSLTIHGITGADSSPNPNPVIPAKVVGKFSIRLVPNQEPEKVKKQVTSYLIEEFVKLNNPNNKLNITMEIGTPAWITNPADDNYLAAKKAIKLVYGTEPDLIRDGSVNSVTILFQNILQKSIIQLPLGPAGNSSVKLVNEKLEKSAYLNGTKVIAAYLYNLSKLPSSRPPTPQLAEESVPNN